LRNAVSAFDDAVDDAFECLRGRPVADWVAYVASETADYSMAWHLIGLTMAATSPTKRAHAVRLAVFLGIESIVVNGVLKQLTNRPRPPLLEERAYEVRRPRTTSFPSGHASSATLAAILFGEALPRAKPLWATLAAVVAASRIHNRMHHASDVAAGTVIGALFALAARRLWPLS
jgi:undecaprenyl-diphosphatase